MWETAKAWLEIREEQGRNECVALFIYLIQEQAMRRSRVNRIVSSAAPLVSHQAGKAVEECMRDGHPLGWPLLFVDPLAVWSSGHLRQKGSSERDASVHRWSMKVLIVIGLLLDLMGVVILGMGAVLKGAASLRSLKESSSDSFDYDVQQRPWYVRLILRLGASLGARTIEAQREPLPYRAFPLTVYGFVLLIVGFLLQLLAALSSVTRLPQ